MKVVQAQKISFTNDRLNSKLDEECSLLLEENEVLPKYHDENAIYLYCTLDKSKAHNIIATNKFSVPLYLYETPEISKLIYDGNIANTSTLRVAVNLYISNAGYFNECYYDELTALDRPKKGDINELKAKCAYIRELVQLPDSKQKVIRYTVNNANKLYINPQYS